MVAPPKPSPPAKRPYHHGGLPAALIQSSLDLIAEKGVRALTLREIGARLGVSRMAAYRHFDDKAKLLAAIREAGFERFAKALEEGRDNGGSGFQERFFGMGIAYVRFAREHPAYFEVMFGSAPRADDAEVCEAEKRAFRLLEELIEEGQACGAFAAGNPRVMAYATWSLVHGISALKLDQETTPADIVTSCANFLFNGFASKAQKNKTQ